MSDTKISALNALTGANVTVSTDVFAIVDTSAGETKKILVTEMADAIHVIGTEQASTSGTVCL